MAGREARCIRVAFSNHLLTLTIQLLLYSHTVPHIFTPSHILQWLELVAGRKACCIRGVRRSERHGGQPQLPGTGVNKSGSVHETVLGVK